MDKIVKFSELLYREILEEYAREGRLKDIVDEEVKNMAYSIASELVRSLPSVNYSSLELCIGLTIRHAKKLSYRSLVQTFESSEYQSKMFSLREAEKPKQLPSDDVAFPLYCSVRMKVLEKYLGLFIKGKTNKQAWEQSFLDQSKAQIQEATRITNELLARGYSKNDKYEGDI